MLEDTTVVLGGGGVWGVAWLTGLTKGLSDGGLNLADAQAFIGTSAGSVLGAQLAAEVPINDLFDRQADPAKQPIEVVPDLQNLNALGQKLSLPRDEGGEWLRDIAEFARAAQTIGISQRRADICRRLGLPSNAWPARSLAITAVDLDAGELVAFNGSSGVRLVDAVAASCAVPGIWPITPVNGRNFIDGGIWRTAENAHLALGAERVLILSPTGRSSALEADIDRLEANGAKAMVVEPDPAAKATAVPHMLAPNTREAAAMAGLAQAQRSVSTLQAFLG